MQLENLLKIVSQKTKKNLKIVKDLGGELNNNFLVENGKIEKYVLRIPKENPRIISTIKEEMSGMGYLKTGLEYKIRTIKEQIVFNEKCISNKIPVQKIIDDGENYLLLEFIEGKTLKEYLKNNPDFSVIEKYFNDIFKTHKKGIIFGDRWGPNTIVTEEKLIEIDFDIELRAEDAKEFEITEIFYYDLLWSKNKEKLSSVITDIINQDKFFEIYDRNRFFEYLNNHTKFFENNIKYGGIELEIAKLTKN